MKWGNRWGYSLYFFILTFADEGACKFAVGYLGEATVGPGAFHIDQIQLREAHVSIHVEQLVEFAHFEEEDGVHVVLFEGPPLQHGGGLVFQEGVGHVESASVEFWVRTWAEEVVLKGCGLQKVEKVVFVAAATYHAFWGGKRGVTIRVVGVSCVIMANGGWVD